MRFLRSWTRAPGVTIGMLVSAAVGVAVATAGLTLPLNTLFPPVPYQVGNRLVEFREAGIATAEHADAEARQHIVSRSIAAELRAHTDAFDAVVEYAEHVNLSLVDRPGTSMLGAGVPHDLFPRLGIKAALGRLFRPEDDQPGAGQVVILSHREWQTEFGSDAGIVGKVLRTLPAIRAGDYTVIGVLDSTSVFPPQGRESFYVPMSSEAMRRQNANPFVTLLAIVQPGVTRARVQAVADISAQRHGATDRELLRSTMKDYVAQRKPVRVIASTFRRMPRDSAEWMGAAMLAGFAFTILAIAALNIASLALARMVRRRSELAVRSALGATRRRLIGALVAETGAVTIAGGALGALAAALLFAKTSGSLGPDVARLLAPNWRIAPIALSVAVLAAMAGVAWPAFQLGRTDLNAILKSGRGSWRRSSGGGFKRVVLLQVALTSMLCVCAATFIAAIAKHTNADRGFDPANAIAIRITTPEAEGARPAALQAALDAVAAIPGVQSAAAGSIPVVGAFTMYRGVAAKPGDIVQSYQTLLPVTARYFDAMGIRLLAGRSISETEARDGSHVVVVGSSMASTLWPAQNALGKLLYLGDDAPTAVAYEVIGVAAEVTMPFPKPLSQIYVPYATRLDRSTTIVARVSGTTASVLRAAQDVLADRRLGIDAQQGTTMAFAVRRGAQLQVASAMLLSVLAIIGLALAAAGLYGVVAYTTGQRAHEFGIRLALGASPNGLLAFTLREAARPVVGGIVVGLGAGAAAAMLMRSLLLGVNPLNPFVLGAVVLLVLSVALVATLHPAMRVARTDPAAPLRAG